MLGQFWRSQAGNYAAIFSIAIIPIMAGVVGIVDFAMAGIRAARLQNSLDATAFAIGVKFHSGMSKAEVQQFGSRFFRANIYKDEVSLETSDEVSNFEAHAVADGEVIEVSVSAKMIHQGFIGGSTTWQATRSSGVRLEPGQTACVLALDAHAAESVMIQKSAQVRVDGCVIASNSDAADSISVRSAGQLAAECVSTGGGAVGLLNSGSELACPQPLEHQYPSRDPLDGVVPPAYTGCKSLPATRKKALSPGTYCNKTWSGNIVLDPGVYVLRGGQIKLGSNGYLIGHRVTIFLMDGAKLKSNGNEFIDLTPSANEPYAGITIFQERGNRSPLTINGGFGSQLSGFIYAPGAHVFYGGNSVMSRPGACVRIVGSTIEFAGNSAIRADCDAELSGRTMSAAHRILLRR